jgi:hypothetical protein
MLLSWPRRRARRAARFFKRRFFKLNLKFQTQTQNAAGKTGGVFWFLLEPA